MIDVTDDTTLKTVLFLAECRKHKVIRLNNRRSRDSLEGILRDALKNYEKLGTGPGTNKPNTDSITRGTNSNDSSTRDIV